MYKVVAMRWRKWIVKAKSGTSFERDTKTSRNMTLIKQFNIHTNPNIHPMVVSPRRESQPKTRSSENGAPYTTVVNKMSTVAQA